MGHSATFTYPKSKSYILLVFTLLNYCLFFHLYSLTYFLPLGVVQQSVNTTLTLSPHKYIDMLAC